MARRSGSITPSTGNSGAVSGPRNTPQVQDVSSARNRNTIQAPRPNTNVQNVSAPRQNVPFRATPAVNTTDGNAANASNMPAHIINIGSPAVKPGTRASGTTYTGQNSNTPNSATGTGAASPGSQLTPARRIGALRNRA